MVRTCVVSIYYVQHTVLSITVVMCYTGIRDEVVAVKVVKGMNL